MSGRSEDDIDEFWSVALMAASSRSHHRKINNDLNSDREFLIDENTSGIGHSYINKSNFLDSEEESDDEAMTTRTFTVLPPHVNQSRNSSQSLSNEMNARSQTPLHLKISMNSNDGILSDVSGIPWDASFLLSGYLFGTETGRRICYDALFGKDRFSANKNRICNDNGLENSPRTDSFGGGILELGSGLGIAGLAAAAAALSFCNNQTIETESKDATNEKAKNDFFANSIDGANRVVMTDLNDAKILSFLKKNVESNVDSIAATAGFSTFVSSFSTDGNAAAVGSLELLVEPCNWLEVAEAFREKSNWYKRDVCKRHNRRNENENCENFPRGKFNLILGSALIYMPDHAAACAETIYHYLKEDCCEKGQTLKSNNRYDNTSNLTDKTHDDANSRRFFSSPQAIVLQFPDRSGFASQFLPRCQELELYVRCFELDRELIKNVELGLNRSIQSAGDYRIYHISKKY